MSTLLGHNVLLGVPHDALHGGRPHALRHGDHAPLPYDNGIRIGIHGADADMDNNIAGDSIVDDHRAILSNNT
ncbi:MAG: hypothetical protein FWE38_04645 [Firmicutes bacterium]|nr:hypothetical protein [Bacillota bacterium]